MFPLPAEFHFNKYKKKCEFSNTVQPGYNGHLRVLEKMSAKTKFVKKKGTINENQTSLYALYDFIFLKS